MPIIIKRFIILILLSLQVFASKSQSKHLTADSDTSFWHNYQNKIAAKLHLDNLNTSSVKQEWRMWYNGQVTSYVLILSPTESRMIVYTQEYRDPVTEQPSERVFSKSYTLNVSQAKSIDSLKEAYEIDKIATGNLIKDWGHGFDGITYNIERSYGNNYSFKSYWTPQAVKAVEAKKMERFIEAVNQVTKQHNWPDFFKSIPFLSYSTGGPAVAMKAVDKKQARSLRKAQKAYRKSHPEVVKVTSEC